MKKKKPAITVVLNFAHLSFLAFGGVDGESPLGGTLLCVDAISDNLAVRVLRNPVACSPFS